MHDAPPPRRGSRPDKCLGPCGRPLHPSTPSACKSPPPGSVVHASKGLCAQCHQKAYPRPSRAKVIPQDTVEEHRRALTAYILDRRARGIPPEGLHIMTLESRNENDR